MWLNIPFVKQAPGQFTCRETVYEHLLAEVNGHILENATKANKALIQTSQKLPKTILASPSGLSI